MAMRDKYNHAIQVAKGLRMQGAAEERDGKLHFNGEVGSEDEKNQIWNAIKAVPDWRNDVVADIRVSPRPPGPAGAGASAGEAVAQAPTATTYTVKPGDTLSKIAKEHLGNANEYMAIFNANKDQLQDPDKIRPGQTLKIPARSQ